MKHLLHHQRSFLIRHKFGAMLCQLSQLLRYLKIIPSNRDEIQYWNEWLWQILKCTQENDALVRSLLYGANTLIWTKLNLTTWAMLIHVETTMAIKDILGRTDVLGRAAAVLEDLTFAPALDAPFCSKAKNKDKNTIYFEKWKNAKITSMPLFLCFAFGLK